MGFNSQQQNALNIHNEARGRLGVAPLSWDEGQEAEAQRWANELAQRDSGLEHNRAGQNLASMGSGSDNLADGTKMWVNERDEVPYVYGPLDDAAFNSGVGHYTQVVWENTTMVGMAVAVGASGTAYVVGNYHPAGNISNEYPYQIHDQPRPNPKELLSFNNGVNNSGQRKSMVAWYSNSPQEHKPGSRLDAQVLTSSELVWEGKTQHVTFDDGNVVTWTIDANAQSKPDGIIVGTAKNNFREFTVHKGDKHHTLNQDGMAFVNIYWAM